MNPETVVTRSWEDIVNSVEKVEIPVDCLKRVTINLLDGKRKQINIAKYRQKGLKNEEIEEIMGKYFFMLNDVIRNVDFIVDINAVEQLVQPLTDQLLAKLA